MRKLSINYRIDDPDGLTLEIENYLDANFFTQVKNTEVKNPKILVVFSGGNAVGKSTLAQKISNEFHGLVLENDAIKRSLLSFDPPIDRGELNKLTWQYSMTLYKKLPTVTSNSFVIRDGVIDWYYNRILPIFLKQGYQLFVIAYDLSRKKQIELINKRGDTKTVNAERLQTILDDHAIHQKRFRAIYKPDIILNDETVFDDTSVIKLLRKRFESMNKI